MKNQNKPKLQENAVAVPLPQICLSDLELPKDLKKLTVPQCNRLCKEIRNCMIETVSQTGGHLASSLGAVEITMALLRCFNSPADKIVWDVGHQTYAHKILTGRYDRFSTLRQEGGISGFMKPEESPHDSFISGHSSTSISLACGMAEAMRMQGKDSYAVAVIGDGALTGGLAYEGLNNGGKLKNLIVILNDNVMSISKNVGSLSRHLRTIRLTDKYITAKRNVEKTLKSLPVVGEGLAKGIKGAKDSVREILIRENTMFSHLGFVYLGPINGHNIEEVEEAINIAKKHDRPVLIHAVTKKGRGYRPAEDNPSAYHGVSGFDIKTGNPDISSGDCYSTVFGKYLTRLADSDESICAITAAMDSGTGLNYFRQKYPNRFFDVGIAEQHAVTFGAGLAASGMKPVFAVYSSFLQRSYDQLLHDVSIGKQHLVLGVDRAGIVGDDGETHQGMFDVPMLTSIPNAKIYSPSCYEELRKCLWEAIYNDEGLVAVRYPRGCDNSSFEKYKINATYNFTRDLQSDTLLISYGRIYDNVFTANGILEKKGLGCDLLKLTCIFPLSEKMLEKVSCYKRVIFFEECHCNGSISQIMGNLLLQNGFKGGYSAVTSDGFIKQASISRCLERLGLDADGIVRYVEEIMNGKA